MTKILQIIILIIIAFLMISASCDYGPKGCMDDTACNYDSSAIEEDESCNYPEENYDCNGNCLTENDCVGVCGGISETDCCGLCDSDNTNNPPEKNDGTCQDIITYFVASDELPEGKSIGDIKAEPVECGCMDDGYQGWSPNNGIPVCNYNPNATHNNDSCAVPLSQFGGDDNGNDCAGECGGTAVKDKCDLCVGGTTNYGQCWQIEIKSIATFKLQNGISMGSDTNSITIGASKYALNGYNGEVNDNEDSECISDYNDYPEPPNFSFEDKNNFIRFFTPHNDGDEWDEWGSKINLDIEPYFDRDIRVNDYHSLLFEGKGMNWFSVIEPTLSDTVIIDTIKFQITHLESIQCSDIKFYLDREKGETDGGIEIEDFELGIEVDTDKEINITINVSNICIREHEFDESCPDN